MFAELLLVLLIANGAPIIACNVLGDRFNTPVDLHRCWRQSPIFGYSKTYRGILASVLFTALAAPLLKVPMVLAIAMAASAMTGDLLSSFIKRRLGLLPSSMALGLDQIPESLLPLLVARFWLELSWWDIVLLILLFFVLELLLSKALYILHIRNRPY